MHRVNDVIRRPRVSEGMPPDMARALEKLKSVRNAAVALGTESDPARTGTAIDIASLAIVNLSREVI